MNNEKLKKVFFEELDKIGNRIKELNKKENPTKEEIDTIGKLLFIYNELQYIEMLANEK